MELGCSELIPPSCAHVITESSGLDSSSPLTSAVESVVDTIQR